MGDSMILRRDSRPWFKELWPWLLMLGPATVVVAGAVTTWLAIVSYDGLVTDDYYKQGLAVNQRLLRSHKAVELGLEADLMRSGNRLRLLLRTEEHRGGFLPASLLLKLSHPTRAGQDQQIILTFDGQGFYGGKMDGETSGRWLVSIEDPESQWRLQGEWLLDSGAPLNLKAK